MRKRFKKLLSLFLMVLLLLLDWPWVFRVPKIEYPKISYASVGDIGHWQDSIGGQIPGTSFAAFEFDDEIRNDGIYTRPDDSTIELDEAGDYLIIGTIKGVDNSNGRYNAQARIALTSGTGTLFTSYYTGFSRDTSEDTAWFRVVGVIIGASADAQFEVQRRRDTDAPTSGSLPGESDVQVVRISPTNYGLYAIGGTSGGLGGTSPNTVDVTSVTAESDTAAIQGNTSTDTITVKGDNKRYLIAWSVSGDTNNNTRTQRIGHLEYDGTDDLATSSYCYQRYSADEYCGLGSMDLLETSTADRDIQVEVYRGPGVSADQGGADQDSTFDVDGNGQMIVLELPDSAEVFRSHDSTGLQNITSAVTLNAMETVDFNDAASFTKASSTVMDVTAAADVFAWANVWTARNNVSSGTRLTAYGSITVNGTEQTVGEHGNYTRGNQSTQDTFAGSFHPAGIYNVGTAGYDVGVNMDPLAGTEGGGTDRTQPGTVGFLAINLDTLATVSSPSFTQNTYRWYVDNDGTNPTEVWGTPDLSENTAITIIPAGKNPPSFEEELRLRINITIGTTDLSSSSQQFKLQFKEGTDGSCTTGSWTDVGSSEAWEYASSSVTDGADITGVLSTTDVNGQYAKSSPTVTNTNGATVGQDIEYDFHIIGTNMTEAKKYSFRVVESDDTVFDSYTNCPTLTTEPGTSNLLRHGNTFSDELEQGFFWAN